MLLLRCKKLNRTSGWVGLQGLLFHTEICENLFTEELNARNIDTHDDLLSLMKLTKLRLQRATCLFAGVLKKKTCSFKNVVQKPKKSISRIHALAGCALISSDCCSVLSCYRSVLPSGQRHVNLVPT
jgi:hypothetical protein